MRRIHTSFDLLEAHVIAARLRADGIAAHVFDADFVRQDWFKMFAYGGFRIVVPDADAGRAMEVLKKYKDGSLALPEEDRAPCPACSAAAGHDDAWPRRNTFIAIVLANFVVAFILAKTIPSAADFLLLFATTLAVGIALPCLATRYFKWRYRCDACGHHWREPPRRSYAELIALADEADPSTHS